MAKTQSASNLSFSSLWAAYPNSDPYTDPKTKEPPAGYENQCAIKVSVTLARVGVKLLGFRGATVVVSSDKAAIRAEELATWLKLNPIPRLPLNAEFITSSSWQQKIKSRVGIVYFSNYWLRPEETRPSGDHIDLWNGSRLTASGVVGTLTTIARFGLGLNAGPGFSDLGKSNSIVFWEVK